jgi:hypothetical protein
MALPPFQNWSDSVAPISVRGLTSCSGNPGRGSRGGLTDSPGEAWEPFPPGVVKKGSRFARVRGLPWDHSPSTAMLAPPADPSAKGSEVQSTTDSVAPVDAIP